jgi:cation transport protein ChaC
MDHGIARQRRLPEPELTRELVRAVHPRPVEEGQANLPLLDDDSVEGLLEACLAAAPRGVRDEAWIFAYGSLIWRPEVEVAESRPAMLAGWHRRFCIWQWRNRGTLANPGLMLALERGGGCAGVALRLSGPGLRDKLRALWRREMRGNSYLARWVRPRTAHGPIDAVAFVMNRASDRYAGRLAPEASADLIAAACGARGPSAEYLCETVHGLRAHGLGDRYLWDLQALVAARLRAMARGGPEGA